EGFHKGATCVVTAVTGHEEYVEHGENGLVVDWDDPRGDSRSLDLLARDHALLHRLRWGALATARGWPSWEQQGTVMAAALRDYAAWAALERDGPVPLAPGGAADTLDVAFVVPAFRRGSGGHVSIAELTRGLERRGHRTAVWIDDPGGRSGGAAAFRAFFGPF